MVRKAVSVFGIAVFTYLSHLLLKLAEDAVLQEINVELSRRWELTASGLSWVVALGLAALAVWLIFKVASSRTAADGGEPGDQAGQGAGDGQALPSDTPVSFTVSPSVPSADKGHRAVLRIHTDQEAEFEAVAEVLEGHPGHDQYQMYWESRRTATRIILPGAPAIILVAEIVRRTVDIWHFNMFRFDGNHWGLFGKRAWDRRDENPLVPDLIRLHVQIAAGSSAFEQQYLIEFGDGGRTMTFSEWPSHHGGP